MKRPAYQVAASGYKPAYAAHRASAGNSCQPGGSGKPFLPEPALRTAPRHLDVAGQKPEVASNCTWYMSCHVSAHYYCRRAVCVINMYMCGCMCVYCVCVPECVCVYVYGCMCVWGGICVLCSVCMGRIVYMYVLYTYGVCVGVSVCVHA